MLRGAALCDIRLPPNLSVERLPPNCDAVERFTPAFEPAVTLVDEPRRAPPKVPWLTVEREPTKPEDVTLPWLDVPAIPYLLKYEV